MTGESRLELLKSLPKDLQIEIVENVMRKDFTESEKAYIQTLLRKELSDQTDQGRRSDTSFNKEHQDTYAESGATNEKIARVLGESRENVRKREHVFGGSLPKETVKALDDGKRSLHSVWAEQKKEENRSKPIPPLPKGKYGHIVEDPGWDFANNIGGRGQSGAALQYRTMPASEIARIPVRGMAADNAVLYMWTTNQHLVTGTMPMSEFLLLAYGINVDINPSVKVQSDALAVMACHGFKSKYIITWKKKGRNGWAGYGFANVTEHLVIGVRGDVRPFGLQDTTIIESDYDGNHSKKPEEGWVLIEKCVDATGWGGKLEMNSREPRTGWKAYGDEVE